MSDGFFSQSRIQSGLQPLGRHAQIGREVRRRLILGNRAEHVALLALQQLEQLPCPAPSCVDAVRTISCVWNGPIVFEIDAEVADDAVHVRDRRGRRSASGRPATAGS